jgi:hypothetical protein
MERFNELHLVPSRELLEHDGGGNQELVAMLTKPQSDRESVDDREARSQEIAAEKKEKLIIVCIDACETLDMALINSLVKSMTGHLDLVIEKAGERISC